MNALKKGISIMAKPAGPSCNLDCEYCFYTEKEALFQHKGTFRMSDQVLETFIRKYIALNDIPLVPFIWQGGESTLMGLDFFRKLINLQKQYSKGRKITNALQTNGTLLNDEWCEFLAEHKFLIGLSLDGPEDIHNRYRCDRGGSPFFDRVMRGLHLLQKYNVEYNVLACVAGDTAEKPLDTYRFFKEEGVRFIQFLPIVERMPDSSASEMGLRLAPPSLPDSDESDSTVTSWSVKPEAYGDFLIEIYDEWVAKDVGSIFVMNFEWALNAWIGRDAPTCHFVKQCGRSLIIEHNGDLYSCDHFVYPRYRLGNILTDDLKAIIESDQQTDFGACKETTLPRYCRECKVLFACRGGCPKQRFTVSHHEESGLNYLCQGYRKFFYHIHKYNKVMVKLLEEGLPVTYVKNAVKGPLLIKRGN